NSMVELAVELATELIEFPRHLSQHVGGYVLTQDRLDTYVPIGNAAMDDRTFIEWDKDDVDALNMMKVDVLALGMLTCIRKCFDLIDDHKGERWELASVPQDDKGVYDMLCRGESLGVFQVESRAQMNMLPRLKPRTFYDLVIVVAIVRHGPIKGFGSYGFPESHAASFAQLVYISSWLKRYHPDAFCCGLLNSQPMGFYAPAQIVGDARKNHVEVREIDVSFSFAQNTLEEGSGKYCAVRFGFRQIDGFSWIDPDEENLKRIQSSFRGASRERNGFELNRSASPVHLAPLAGRGRILRAAKNPGEGGFPQTPLGESPPHPKPSLRYGSDLSPQAGRGDRSDGELDWAERIIAARTRRPFTSLEDFARDTGLPKRALIPLADADAFRPIGLDSPA